MAAISVTTVVRGKEQLADELTVPLPDTALDSGLSLRQLIEHAVRFEIERFRRRQTKWLMNSVLTSDQIQALARKGKVNESNPELEVTVDAGEASRMAVSAFEEKAYLVLVDGRRLTRLDERVPLGSDSEVAFLRLARLTGRLS